MEVRGWDADAYHRVSGPMEAMGRAVLERLPLAGDETVLDAGCGTGRVTALLAERLPSGRVMAVDLSAEMTERARRNLGPRVDVVRADLLTVAVTRPVDAIFSTATFHWIRDHDRLFANLFALLGPGGRLVAQCGGQGNIAELLGAASRVAGAEPFRTHLDGFERPMRFADADTTRGVLEKVGFVEVRCWVETRPVVPDDPLAYLRTVTCGPHLEQLPADLRDPFLEQVADEVGDPVTIDYMRLNIDARSPGDR